MRILHGKSAALGQSKLWQNRDKLVEVACFVQVGSMLQTKSSLPVCRMEIVLPAPGRGGPTRQEKTSRECEAAGAMLRLLVP